MTEGNGSDLAVVERPAAGLSLVEGPNPAAAVAYAAQVSTAIAGVLEEGNGVKTIQGKKHITIEGWQTLAAMTGHSVEVEWSRPVEGLPADDKGHYVWEARALVRDQNGRVVATGESMADPGETGADRKWARGGNFSIRSMAQTRAMSRALSSRMRYIVQLAGFSGTPAEEMDGVSAEQGGSPAKPARAEVIASRQAEAEQRAGALGVTDFVQFFSDLGVNHPDKLYSDTTWKKVTAELDKREQEAAPAVEPDEVSHPDEQQLPGTEDAGHKDPA